jgi:hypothetical protein
MFFINIHNFIYIEELEFENVFLIKKIFTTLAFKIK